MTDLARRICGYRTWQGCALVARIVRRTAKAALLSNDTAQLWVPLSQILKVDERPGINQVHVKAWFIDRNRDQLSISDPLNIADKRAMASEAAAEYQAHEQERWAPEYDPDSHH